MFYIVTVAKSVVLSQKNLTGMPTYDILSLFLSV